MSNRPISVPSCPVPGSSRTSARALGRATDEDLVDLARSGSAHAFEAIAHRYQRQLRSYCAQFVGPALAEDAVQQALLRAYVALRGESRRDIALRPWLYRIARNCAIDLLRSAPPDHEQLDLEYDGVPQPPRLLEQKEEMGRLVAALHELPESQRRALTLRELEGRSYQEISRTLGQSGPGVRQMIFRARTTLRSGFGALLPVGLLRSRILGPAHPVPEAHHVAAVTKISGCGGLEAVGVVAAAALTLVTGMPVTPAARPTAHPPQPHVAQVAPSRPVGRLLPPASGGASARGGLTGLRLSYSSLAAAAGAPPAEPVRGYSVARSAGRPTPAVAPAEVTDGPDGEAAAEAGLTTAGGPANAQTRPAGAQSDGRDPDGTGSPPSAGAGLDPAAGPAPGADPPAPGSGPTGAGEGCIGLTCGEGLLR